MGDAHDKDYFLNKALQCFRLADACTNEEVEASLRKLGHEFMDEAVKRGADPALRPKD